MCHSCPHPLSGHSSTASYTPPKMALLVSQFLTHKKVRLPQVAHDSSCWEQKTKASPLVRHISEDVAAHRTWAMEDTCKPLGLCRGALELALQPQEIISFPLANRAKVPWKKDYTLRAKKTWRAAPVGAWRSVSSQSSFTGILLLPPALWQLGGEMRGTQRCQNPGWTDPEAGVTRAILTEGPWSECQCLPAR